MGKRAYWVLHALFPWAQLLVERILPTRLRASGDKLSWLYISTKEHTSTKRQSYLLTCDRLAALS